MLKIFAHYLDDLWPFFITSITVMQVNCILTNITIKRNYFKFVAKQSYYSYFNKKYILYTIERVLQFILIFIFHIILYFCSSIMQCLYIYDYYVFIYRSVRCIFISSDCLYTISCKVKEREIWKLHVPFPFVIQHNLI